MATLYHEAITTVVDKLPPKRKKVMINKQRPKWFTPELLQERQNVRSLERKWLKSKLTWERDLFVTARSNYNKLLNDTKANFFKSKIDETCDSKKLFSIVDEISGNKSMGASVLPDVERVLLPDMFADFFCDKIVKIRSKFECTTSTEMYDGTTISISSSLSSFSVLTVEAVVKVIKEMNTKSCALDPIPVKFIKECVDVWAPALTHIVNSSFKSGIFPENCKFAIVRPLIKKNDLDQNELKNYRPVSNCSFLDKFLEKCAFKKINECLNANSLYGKFQSAYRENHGTETALLRVYNDVMMSLDSRKDVVLVLLDLSAAFDTIDHTILLHRLETRFRMEGKVRAGSSNRHSRHCA